MIGFKRNEDNIEISKKEMLEILDKLSEAKKAIENLAELSERYGEFIDTVLTGMEGAALGPLNFKMIPSAVKLYAVGCHLRNRKPAGVTGH